MSVRALSDALDEVLVFLRRFVVLSEAQSVALALWVVHTHACEAAEATPYLAITSAEKRSGKSRLLEVLALVVARPLRAAGATEAALFRSLAASPPPTLLMDEVDTLFGPKAMRDHEDLRALLNAGHRRGTPVPAASATARGSAWSSSRSSPRRRSRGSAACRIRSPTARYRSG